MKPILFYDTETNGLPLWNEPSDHPGQPHITQLAAELFDADSGRTLAFMDLMIEPDGWTIPAELEQLTGITNELAQRFGHPLDGVLGTFVAMWSEAELRVECGLKDIRFTTQEGGSVGVHFKITAHPKDDEDHGKIARRVQQEIGITLTPPDGYVEPGLFGDSANEYDDDPDPFAGSDLQRDAQD